MGRGAAVEVAGYPRGPVPGGDGALLYSRAWEEGSGAVVGEAGYAP